MKETEDQSSALKQRFKAHFEANGICGHIPPALYLEAKANPLEWDEASAEFLAQRPWSSSGRISQDAPVSKGFARSLAELIRSIVARMRGPTEAKVRVDQDELDDAEIESMHAWSITTRLAALPETYIDQVPVDVASLIREAKGLHPQMAAGANKRDARGEPCPVL